MSDDVERIRIHAAYSRRIARGSLADALDRAADALEAAPPASATHDPYALLREWMAWWSGCEAAPSKLPEALQIRTGIALARQGISLPWETD